MKALALFSGGLDSSLAIKIIQAQKIQILALNFLTPFSALENRRKVEQIARELGVNLQIEFLGEEYLEIVKHPKYGYGKHLNPCLDCRILMLKKAKEVMETINASFVITGEVVGQRPMSQYKSALQLVERESGLKELIVRPLSAKLLTPTIPEKNGWIDRNSLFGIYGRARREQIELARQWKIKHYFSPAGGCLLTDPAFSQKISDLLAHNQFSLESIELLRLGRHFRLSPSAKLVVGRNKRENEQMLQRKREKEIYFRPVGAKGPVAVGQGEFNPSLISLAVQIIAHYCNMDLVDIEYRTSDRKEKIRSRAMEEKEIERFRVIKDESI